VLFVETLLAVMSHGLTWYHHFLDGNMNFCWFYCLGIFDIHRNDAEPSRFHSCVTIVALIKLNVVRSDEKPNKLKKQQHQTDMLASKKYCFLLGDLIFAFVSFKSLYEKFLYTNQSLHFRLQQCVLPHCLNLHVNDAYQGNVRRIRYIPSQIFENQNVEIFKIAKSS